MTSLLAVLILVLSSETARAKTVKGPGVAVEEAQPGQVHYQDEREDGPDPDLKIRRRRYEANLLVPIPARILGGMFVLKGDFFKECRTLAGTDAANTTARSDDVLNPNVAGTGAIFLPHAKEGAPKFFVLAARFGSLSLDDHAAPMSEYVLGADLADDDLPFTLKFSPTDDSESRVLVRYRQFPGFHRWLFLIGHRIDTVSGWSFDVTIPKHILIGWETPAADWKVYGGLRWTGLEYPFATPDATGWQEGYTTTRLVGVRRDLAKPIYLALEAGVQKEHLAYIDTKGETLAEHETAFAPWARLAVETWITTP